MPWFRLDDSFHSHPKVLAAGNEATGLYVRCGTYAAQHLTDGFIPEQVALQYGTPALVETLVATKLWRRARGGWRMPDYLDYNPSKEAVDNDRRQKAERQARWREKHGPRHNRDTISARSTTSGEPVDNSGSAENARSEARGRRVSNASSNGVSNAAPSRPAPKGSGTGTPPVPGAAANGRPGPTGPAARGRPTPQPPPVAEVLAAMRQPPPAPPTRGKHAGDEKP